MAQVQKFETRKAQLQQRVTLIEQLRRGQTGPVHIVDEISKAIPDRLWLSEMTQKGDDLTIVGMTTSLTGVSDFVANLETSPWFKRPIDIIDSQMASDPKSGGPREVLGEGHLHQPGRSRASAGAGSGETVMRPTRQLMDQVGASDKAAGQ